VVRQPELESPLFKPFNTFKSLKPLKAFAQENVEDLEAERVL